MEGKISIRGKGNYEVETPYSVASVRDTEFNVSSPLWEMSVNDDEILVEVQSKKE